MALLAPAKAARAKVLLGKVRRGRAASPPPARRENAGTRLHCCRFAARSRVLRHSTAHCAGDHVLLVGFRRSGGVGVFVQVRRAGLGSICAIGPDSGLSLNVPTGPNCE
jgi:hypothetical protein